ncbi:MAG: glycine cleavage system protein H [Betaproteobacteria bacterium HGW-Betaproteobacteria-22]|nr:MAG: glycine cleavage system protein H [Betaproteobacteria bacterium HGW-Betaproteobacteria-22]
MKTPQDLLFSSHHLWARPSADGNWEAGITDYAQDLLGDIVFIDAPAVGSKLHAGKPCGLVESVKTGSDLHALVNGEVMEINQAVIDMPEQLNEHPYQAWIFKFKADNNDLAASLLSAQAYDALTDAL